MCPRSTIAPRAIGALATLQLSEFPGRTFTGTLVRNANAIDPASRTLLVEVEVDNPTGELLSGLLRAGPSETARDAPRHGFTVPVSTLLFRSEGLRVGRGSRRPRAAGPDHDRPRLRQ